MHPFVIISAIVSLISPLIYARSILWGQSKPHRTTRLTILLIAVLSVSTLFAAGDRVAFWLALVSTLQAIFIFILSIKYGMGGWAKSDIVCLMLALIGILAWKLTDNPILGLTFSILADFAGIIPTLFKSYRLPHTELWQFYGLDVLSSTLIILAVPLWSYETLIYPLYIFVINLAIVILIFLGNKSNHNVIPTIKA